MEPVELRAEELRFPASLVPDFATTTELPIGDDFIGQERAKTALEIGLGVHGKGFHIFVSGLTGTDRLHVLQDWVTHQAAPAPTPDDVVYVHNFARPDTPVALRLAAGQGACLKACMNQLVKTLGQELPKAFRQAAFDQEKTQLKDKYSAKAEKLGHALEQHAREKGIFIQSSSGDMVILVPLVNGKPLSPEEFAHLSDQERSRIEQAQAELAKEIGVLHDKERQLRQTLAEDIRRIERRFGEALITPFLETISGELHNAGVEAYLAAVKEHILDHLDDFTQPQPTAAELPFLPEEASPAPSSFLEYEVNVVVDNSQTRGAPVLVESAPTYLNLFGAIERIVDRFGRLVTNFTRIKAGAFLRANGGYLIFNLEDAMSELAVWRTLKRTLKSGRIAMETYEPFGLFATSGLTPEPVRIDVKVVVVGSPWLYHLLYALDPDFRDIFKIQADFRSAMENDAQHQLAYGQWTAQVCHQDGLPPVDRAGVERLIEFGARQAGDRDKVSAAYAEIADIVREAAYWASRDHAGVISAQHVTKALEERVFRSNRIEEELRERIRHGTLLVDIDGYKLGHCNSLAVVQIGDYSFGHPIRITASVGMGQAGLINIEREAKLSGALHDKGLLILSGYLRNRYGQDKPLALSASLCFEQSYAGVEGDSASAAELYALLSQLAELPLRQDLAVTGSVNQWGEVQAVDRVNEKIEGFFDVCRLRGLSGRQGIVLPAANVRHLVLRTDVVEAVAQGQFHLYPIQTIDDGLPLLTGVQAGTVKDADTVNGRVSRRLYDLAKQLKAFAPERPDGRTNSAYHAAENRIEGRNL